MTLNNRWFTVRDEEGIALRLFDTKDEAERFLQPGWTINEKPIPPRKSIYELLGPAPF
jgi:hypothetical protein